MTDLDLDEIERLHPDEPGINPFVRPLVAEVRRLRNIGTPFGIDRTLDEFRDHLAADLAGPGVRPYVDEMFSALVARTNERDEARAEVERLRNTRDPFDYYGNLRAERDAARAEVEGLRRALDILRIENHDWRSRYEALHDGVTRLHSPASSPLAGPTWCVECQNRPEEGKWWPCPTAAELDRSPFGDDRTEPGDDTVEAVAHVVDLMHERDALRAAVRAIAEQWTAGGSFDIAGELIAALDGAS